MVSPVTEQSSAEQPWPVRVVSQKISAWIGRLGWIWVDGQVAQLSRRPGSATVFLTLRDPSADLSLTVTASRDVLDSGAPQLSEGARVVLHAKPEWFAQRGTLTRGQGAGRQHLHRCDRAVGDRAGLVHGPPAARPDDGVQLPALDTESRRQTRRFESALFGT